MLPACRHHAWVAAPPIPVIPFATRVTRRLPLALLTLLLLHAPATWAQVSAPRMLGDEPAEEGGDERDGAGVEPAEEEPAVPAPRSGRTRGARGSEGTDLPPSGAS